MSTSFAARPVPLGMAEHLDKPVFTGACGTPPPGPLQNGSSVNGRAGSGGGAGSSTEDSQASEPELVEYTVGAPGVVSAAERCASLAWPAPTCSKGIAPSAKVLYTLELQVGKGRWDR